MRFGSYYFRPRILPTSLAILGVVFLINLGYWQLDRAVEKELILSDIASKKTSKALTLADLDKLEDINYYRFNASGQYDNKHYLLLDNRFYKSRPGFEVIQPLIVGERVILVNRGWIPLPLDRNDLPEIPTVDGIIEVRGEVNEPTEAIVLKIDQLSAKNSWPQLVQSLEIEKLSKLYAELDLKIEPWVLRQEVTEDAFYKREWIFVAMRPEKHVSYAVTWFGLALALIIIYIAAATSREEIKIGTDEV
ncbi:MAG: surfeit locus 1 family protein [Enterobacterales bacterium]|jgi:surfeit locus 1 family protein